MKYAMKEESRASSRFVFYIDTDAKRIAFIDWYAKKVETMRSLFEHLDTHPFVDLCIHC